MDTDTREPVLVTGGTGYLATHTIDALLRAGHRVRTTVRDSRRSDALVEALRRAGHDPVDSVEIVEADLGDDEGWADAVAGTDAVLHLASPFPATAPRDEEEIIAPARDGAVRVLRAARDAGARRVVMTSSFAAVGYSPTDDPTFTEEDWTDPDADIQPYIRSKVIAERAAWDFVDREGGGLELAVVNPVGIFGPALSPQLSTSVGFIRSMLTGSMESLPSQHFGVVDVRDAADLHLRALHDEHAAGERFLAVADGPSVSFADVARLLHEELGDLASRVPLTVGDASSDGSDPVSIPTISNAKAKRMLGWQPRSVTETIVDTATSLRDLGLLS